MSRSTSGPRVALFGDRLARSKPRGLDTYYQGLVCGLERLQGTLPFRLVSSPEPSLPPPGRYGDVPVSYLPMNRRLLHLAWSILGEPRIDRWLADADLLHVMAPTVPVATEMPLIATIHDLTPIQFPQYYTLLSRIMFKRTVELMVRKAAWMIVDSDSTRDDVIRLTGADAARVTTIHLGIDAIFRPVSDWESAGAVRERYGIAPRPYLLFVGALEPRKNLPLLLRAFRTIRARFRTHCLVLAGNPGKDSVDLLRLISELELEKDVVLTGYVHRPDLPILIGASDAFVLPSTYEGFGLPPVEAMACGTPVVASAAGSLPEVVGNAALLFPSNDVTALAGALESVLEDKTLRHRLIDRGFQRAGQFNWDRAAERTWEIYGAVHAGYAEAGIPARDVRPRGTK